MPDTIQKKEYDETQRIVADMLTESTGVHMMDSGGSSGRAWQRNQKAVEDAHMEAVEFFDSLPESKFGYPTVHPHENHRDPDFKIKGGTEAELWVIHNIWHWLTQACTYAPEIDKLLDTLSEQMDEGKENWDKPSWFEIYREFPEFYARQVAIKRAEEDEGRIEWNESREAGESEMTAEDWVEAHGLVEKPRGIYGEGEWFEDYTYNYENCLGQDLHYIWFTLDDDNGGDDGIALIMIHNGADARGGFTRPRAFYAPIEGDSPSFLDFNRYGIACTECSAIWNDCGGEWNGGDYDEHIVLDLKEYNAREGTALDAAFLNAETGVLIGDEKPWIVIEQRGKYADDDTTVYCPVCGKGELQPWFY